MNVCNLAFSGEEKSGEQIHCCSRFPGILLGAPCPEALPLPSLIAGAATLDYHELEEMPEKLRGILSLGTARLALPADSLTLLQMG